VVPRLAGACRRRASAAGHGRRLVGSDGSRATDAPAAVRLT
jgi:hypothetical protein